MAVLSALRRGGELYDRQPQTIRAARQLLNKITPANSLRLSQDLSDLVCASEARPQVDLAELIVQAIEQQSAPVAIATQAGPFASGVIAEVCCRCMEGCRRKRVRALSAMLFAQQHGQPSVRLPNDVMLVVSDYLPSFSSALVEAAHRSVRRPDGRDNVHRAAHFLAELGVQGWVPTGALQCLLKQVATASSFGTAEARTLVCVLQVAGPHLESTGVDLSALFSLIEHKLNAERTPLNGYSRHLLEQVLALRGAGWQANRPIVELYAPRSFKTGRQRRILTS
eukprot:TRINITY_DN39450_c0_g1_i1.p1 TRINITY_DN39450_c0_g1~~TRINITY_DN39450_c0_g1_i1.p1  ORF type:complete len:311 (+),score=74.80 TRINITY_DN39450_c0_g1_i1:89-934(+)